MRSLCLSVNGSVDRRRVTEEPLRRRGVTWGSLGHAVKRSLGQWGSDASGCIHHAVTRSRGGHWVMRTVGHAVSESVGVGDASR